MDMVIAFVIVALTSGFVGFLGGHTMGSPKTYHYHEAGPYPYQPGQPKG